MSRERRSRRLPKALPFALLVAAAVTAARPAQATDPPAPVTVTPALPDGAPSASGGAQAPEPDAASSSAGTVGWTLGAIGLVGIGVGAVFGGLAISSWSSATSGCAPPGDATHCVATNPSQVSSDHDAAQRDAAISSVSFILGGALVLAGGAVLLTRVHHGDSVAMSLAPTIGPGHAGLAWSGSF